MKGFKTIIFIIIITILGFTGGLFFGSKGIVPQERHFTIEARQYAYNPPRIKVNKGDKVYLRFSSKDVTHGFFLEAYDIDCKIRAQYPHFWVRHPSVSEEYEQAEEISFIADKPGKFRYRCSITCGYLHPFMQGELIVEPNLIFPVSIGLSVSLILASLVYFKAKG